MTMLAELSSVRRSSELQEKRVSWRPSPGILVFSSTGQLQYVNRRACDMIQPIDNAGIEPGFVLPLLLMTLRDEIQAGLDDRLGAQIREPFEMSRVVSVGEHRLLFRGFGQPDSASGIPARIIVLVEEIGGTETNGPCHPQ